MPEGDDPGTLKITRHDDTMIAKAFEVPLKAQQNVI